MLFTLKRDKKGSARKVDARVSCFESADLQMRTALACVFYRKIHYLTREFRVKLHAKTDIARIAKR